MSKQLDLLQGTLDMLILKAISLSPLHGYGILLRIQQISKERLEIQQGSLYPPFTVSNITAGLRAIGVSPKTTAVPATTASPRPESALCKPKANAGTKRPR